MDITNIVLQAYNEKLSVSEIVNHLVTNHKDKLETLDLVEIEKNVENILEEIHQELEADAYLSSLECYYDNYCEY